MNRRSARNRHRPEPLPAIPQEKKHYVDPKDFAEMVGLGSQIIPKFHAQAIANSAEISRAGVRPIVVALLAGAGATGRAVAQVIAKHVEEPKPGDDLRQVFPAWAVDILVVLGVIPPLEAPEPVTEDAPAPVSDETDLAQRAAAAGLVIAS